MASDSASSDRAPTRLRGWASRPHAAQKASKLERRVGPNEGISDEGYRHLIGATQELLAAYPPDRYFYVGVGRSPSALVEALQALVPHGAQGFPVSGLSARANRAISAEPRAEYERHLDHFFPKPERLQGRTILLMDSVSGGATLLRMKEIFEGFLRSRGIEARVETMAIRGRSPNIDHTLPGPFDPMKPGGESIARYDAHYIGKETLEDLRRNPARKPFVLSLLARLYGDDYVDRLAARGFKLLVLSDAGRSVTLDTAQAVEELERSATRSPIRPEDAERKIRETLAKSFEGTAFVGPDRSTPRGPLVMELRRRHGATSWTASSPIPEERWRNELGKLGAELEALARGPHHHSALYELRITLPINDLGELQPSGIGIERVRQRVLAGGLRSPRKELPVDHGSRRGPKPDASAEELAAYLKEGLSNRVFMSHQDKPVRSASIALGRSSPNDHGEFTVLSNIQSEETARALEHTGRAFDGLARRMNTTRLDVDLDFDARGMIRDVRIVRGLPSVTVQPSVSYALLLDVGHTPAKLDATPEMLVRHLVRGLAGVAYRTPSGERARSISFELQPSEDWAGRPKLKLTSQVALTGLEAHIEAAIPMLDRLTQSVGGAGPRSGLRVTLPLKNGEVQTEGASVERLESRFTLRPDRRLQNPPIRVPADGDGASESVNVRSLERALAESFQGMTFHTLDGKPADRVRVEVRVDTAGRELTVYSDVPEGAFRHAVERYGRALERLSRDASDPSKRHRVEIELSLDDQGRVEADGVRMQQL
jgi:hypothetical protein